jgi:phage/plasmid-like protein (TIGR03299 family)
MTTDVNAGFDTERAAMTERQAGYAEAWQARLDSGKLVSLGNGRFKVNDPGSWDNGEIWNQRTSGIFVPQHGLDMTSGEAALYTVQPEWHKLGTVIEAGLSSVPAVLKAAHLDWDVLQRPVRYNFKGQHEVPSAFVNLRSDNGAPLGVVGKVYAPWQNSDSFAFLQDIVDDGSVVFDSAGALDDGRRTFVVVELPEGMEVTGGDVKDHIRLYVAVLNSHDGQGKVKALVTPWRIRCGNTERFAARDAVTTWGTRHTKNAKDRALEAQRTLGMTQKFAASFEAEEARLAETPLELDEFTELVGSLWELPAEPSPIQVRRAAERTDELVSWFAQESAELGQTAYAAERTVTDWLDHAAPRRATGDKMAAARATAIFEGADDDKKTTAHEKLLLKVR